MAKLVGHRSADALAGNDPDVLPKGLLKIALALDRPVLEFRPGIVGIAAPVLSRSGNALASIGLAFPKRKLKTRKVDTLVTLVREAAATLSKRICRSEWALDLPARRIGRIRE